MDVEWNGNGRLVGWGLGRPANQRGVSLPPAPTRNSFAYGAGRRWRHAMRPSEPRNVSINLRRGFEASHYRCNGQGRRWFLIGFSSFCVRTPSGVFFFFDFFFFIDQSLWCVSSASFSSRVATRRRLRLASLEPS